MLFCIWLSEQMWLCDQKEITYLWNIVAKYVYNVKVLMHETPVAKAGESL